MGVYLHSLRLLPFPYSAMPPKKFKEPNSKAVAAKERKAAAKREDEERRRKEEEDEYWKDDDKHVLRKQDRKVM